MKNILKESNVHYIWIKTNTNNQNKLIMKISKLGVNIYSTVYENDYVLFKIKEKDYQKTKKHLISYEFKKVKDEGIFNFKNLIKKYNRFLVAIIFAIALIYFFSNVIVKVNVIHSKKEVRELITNELEEYGIKRLTLKKNYNELQKIKSSILNKYPDHIEWIEIEVVGMTYNVRIEERIITDTKQENNYCHVVADKSGIITKVVTFEGVSNVNINSYVSKGDILISGEIKLNDEVKNNICASGNVFGEIWYTVDVSLPLEYEIINKTGKMRYNFMYEDKQGGHVVLRSRLNQKVVENIEIFSLLGRKLYLQKEHEINVKKARYTEAEALEKALVLAREKVNVKLNENERILSQKVLKKSINDSKMILEVFTSVEEQIGVIEEYTVDLAKENKNDLGSS